MSSPFLRLPVRARRLAAISALALLTATLAACGGGNGGTPSLLLPPAASTTPPPPSDTGATKPEMRCAP
jgi:hypothetical protein